MLDPAVLGFVRAALPPPPGRVLEVGAGRGELAAALREAGHAVVAIDPEADDARGVDPVALADVDAADASFDAAVAVVSLHHVEPLAESCARLGAVVRARGILAIDEFDIACLDERAEAWQAHQRAAAGHGQGDHAGHGHADHAGARADLRAHMHPLAAIREALAPWFALGEPVRGPYLYRWELDPALRPVEEELIARGALPATGARLVGVRR
jgi:SAM-dependent methyltransferase